MVQPLAVTPGYRCEIENIGESRRNAFEFRLFEGDREVAGEEAEGITVEFLVTREGINKRKFMIPAYIPEHKLRLAEMEEWTPPEGEIVTACHFYFFHSRSKCRYYLDTAPLTVKVDHAEPAEPALESTEVDEHPRWKYVADDLQVLTKKQLKEMCRDEGLKVSGKKADLVLRLASVTNPFSTPIP